MVKFQVEWGPRNKGISKTYSSAAAARGALRSGFVDRWWIIEGDEDDQRWEMMEVETEVVADD